MARVKTENKRLELLLAATEVFLEQGFDQTLMSHISDRAKCSKGTLYSYFASKQELFCEAIFEATAQEASVVVIEPVSKDEAVDDTLTRFGVSYLKMAYNPRFQALRRLVFAATSDIEVGRTVYQKAVKPHVLRAADFLASAMKRGRLRDADPELAAWHFIGLLESESLLKFLMHSLEGSALENVDAVVGRTVKVFCDSYKV
ncbi:TetR/AcrR family transcriptional regulator [Comamonas testosteroni]|uniref:TetR/AcrR family transcriptional regulator n=1 Tax=Comamonas testosteroni TaxID=285 RepID=UPI0018C70E8E|nr:TetR/AcrR family transcriptional regulator [Comamonas testosteroni]